MAKLRDIAALLLFIIASQLAGIIGSVFTFEAIPSWYSTLDKPFFTPPSWVFAPVWTLLYLMMGVAAFLVWKQGSGKPAVRKALAVFGFQLLLNTLWSIAFFGMRSPLAGIAVIIPLWLAIAWCIVLFSRISGAAAWLMAPYLAWVSFATALNAAIAALNP